MYTLHDRPPLFTAEVRLENWSLATPFKISRGIQSEVSLIVVELQANSVTGRGECCPVAHFDETPEVVMTDIEAALAQLENDVAWHDLHDQMAPGAARNAIDCAVWDLSSKASGDGIWALAGIDAPVPQETVMTISIDEPAVMARAAAAARDHVTLKLKLGKPGDVDRVAAVRAAVPGKRLIADINEGWGTSRRCVNACPRLPPWASR